jgi:hypothetical protein
MATRDIPSILPLLRPPAHLLAGSPRRDQISPRDSDAFKDPTATTSFCDWLVSTHVCPAAWPRTRTGSAVRNPANVQIPLGDKARTLSLAEKLLSSNTNAPIINIENSESYADEPLLWVCANRYYRRRPKTKGHLTLVLSHATGLHKEVIYILFSRRLRVDNVRTQTWEPLLAALFSSRASDEIAEIWSLDCVNHGDSGIINRPFLGQICGSRYRF